MLDIKKYIKNYKKLILLYNFINIFISILFYPIIPKLLYYPPNSINNEFQLIINEMTYTSQYLLIIALCIIIENIILIISFRNVFKNIKRATNLDLESKKELYIKVEKALIKIPNLIYLLLIIIPVIMIAFTFWNLNGDWIIILKVSMIFSTMLVSTETITYIFSKKIFKDILIDIFYEMNNNSTILKDVLKNIRRNSIKNIIFITSLSMSIVGIFFVGLIGYSNITKTNGELTYQIYKEKLNNIEIAPQTDTFSYLDKQLKQVNLINTKDSYYIIEPNGNIYTSDNQELSEFFTTYSKLVSKTQQEKDRTYDFYGKDVQGVFKELNLNNEIWTVGIKYNLLPSNFLIEVLLVFIILIILLIILLYCTTKYIIDDIKMVSESLNKIAKSKLNINYKLAISSNDEISDLIKSFTKVQDKVEEYLKEIEENQYTMQRQAQFSILGEFARRNST